MTDPIISPDGKYMLVDGNWIPLPGQNVNIADTAIAGDVSIESNINLNVSNNSEKQIRNLAELCIDKLNNGDMKSASELYSDAKKLDYPLAKSLFTGEYHLRLGEAYADIVENYLVRIYQNDINYEFQNFGYGVVNHDITGHYKAYAMLDMLEIAFNNVSYFLGEPDEIVPGGFDFDFTDVIDEFGNIDYDSVILAELNGLEFSKQPDERAVKQKYRIGLALETAALNIWNDVTEIMLALPPGEAMNVDTGDEKPGELADLARMYTIKVVAIAVHEKYDIDIWKEEFSPKLDLLKKEKEASVERRKRIENMVNERLESIQRMREELAAPRPISRRPTQSQTSDCFIATAAFGTSYDKKIDVLRCWRDTKLVPSRTLVKFVRIYYRLSPPIARFMRARPIVRFFTRCLLTPIIFVVSLLVRNNISSWEDNGNPVFK